MKDAKENATPSAEPTMTGIMVTKEAFARDYVVINGEETVKVPVASVSGAMPVLNAEGEAQFSNSDGRALEKHIINLKAVAGGKADAIRELFKGRDEIDLGELRGLTLSYNAIVPASGEFNLPFKGQNIVAVGKYYPSRDDKNKMVLGIANISVPYVPTATAFSFEEEDAEVIETPEV